MYRSMSLKTLRNLPYEAAEKLYNRILRDEYQKGFTQGQLVANGITEHVRRVTSIAEEQRGAWASGADNLPTGFNEE